MDRKINCRDLPRCVFLRKFSGCVRNITAFWQQLLRPIKPAVLADTDTLVKPKYRPIYRSTSTVNVGNIRLNVFRLRFFKSNIFVSGRNWLSTEFQWKRVQKRDINYYQKQMTFEKRINGLRVYFRLVHMRKNITLSVALWRKYQPMPACTSYIDNTIRYVICQQGLSIYQGALSHDSEKH